MPPNWTSAVGRFVKQSTNSSTTAYSSVNAAVAPLSANCPSPKGKADDDWEPRPQTLFRSTDFGDDVDRPLKKSDGGWTYFAPDIAYHFDKVERGFDELINVFGAETEAEAKRIRTSSQLGMARLRSGRPGKLPAPVDRIEDHLDPAALAMVAETQAVTACGTLQQVTEGIETLVARYRPDEVILAGQIHGHAERVRSFEIAAQAMRDMTMPAAAE